ncbi:hypothetical protein C8R45DRAFT_1160546 [Mycena sanguinolenta]|nr:hypothetical protein C8R45DRAFT_1160546 [Mycena sanguinolenta]
MHPSLDPANFSTLPAPLRPLAVAAASGSVAETLDLLHIQPSLVPSHLLSTLPAFYAGLDPARIDTVLSRIDASGWGGVKPVIVHAVCCLSGIDRIMTHAVVADAAFGDLWHRIWPWIQFVDEYDDYLSRDEYTAPAARYRTFLALIRSLCSHAATKELMDSTLGRWVVLGRAWCHFIDAQHEPGLNLVGYLLTVWHIENFWKSADFEELVFGAGGTRTNLASLVVSHIRHFLPNPDSPVTQMTISHIFTFIRIAGNQGGGGPKDPDPEFQAALLSHGLVAAFTTALRAMGRSSLPEASRVLHVLVGILADIIAVSPPQRLRESLRAGLLEIIFNPGQREVLSESLVGLVQGVILPATVYRSVVVELQAVLPEVRDRDASAIFCDEVLLAEWEHLNEVVASRSRIAEEYKTGVITVPRICDDLENLNGRSAPKSVQKKTSSVAADVSLLITVRRHVKGTTGGTSLHTRIPKPFTTTSTDLSHVSPGDQSFFRVLMHHEYTTRGEEIEQKQHVFMEENNERALWIMFNFVGGSCEIELIPLSGSYMAAFPLDVERATVSLDEVRLHVINIMDKFQSRLWAFHVHLKTVEVDWLES